MCCIADQLNLHWSLWIVQGSMAFGLIDIKSHGCYTLFDLSTLSG